MRSLSPAVPPELRARVGSIREPSVRELAFMPGQLARAKRAVLDLLDANARAQAEASGEVPADGDPGDRSGVLQRGGAPRKESEEVLAPDLVRRLPREGPGHHDVLVAEMVVEVQPGVLIGEGARRRHKAVVVLELQILANSLHFSQRDLLAPCRGVADAYWGGPQVQVSGG